MWPNPPSSSSNLQIFIMSRRQQNLIYCIINSIEECTSLRITPNCQRSIKVTRLSFMLSSDRSQAIPEVESCTSTLNENKSPEKTKAHGNQGCCRISCLFDLKYRDPGSIWTGLLATIHKKSRYNETTRFNYWTRH